MYEILIALICGLGLAWSSYKLGRRDGAESLLNLLQSKKIICYDDKGNIKPNQFFDAWLFKTYK